MFLIFKVIFLFCFENGSKINRAIFPIEILHSSKGIYSFFEKEERKENKNIV